MDDAALVRRLEGRGDLYADGACFVGRQGAAGDTLGQRRTFDEFQHERFDRELGAGRPSLLQSVDRRDVGMIQRRENHRLALEPGEPLHVDGQRGGKDFQRDVAIEPRVACSVHLTHPTGAKDGRDFVGSEPGTRRAGHEGARRL